MVHPKAVADCASKSSLLETVLREGRSYVRRKHPYTAAEVGNGDQGGMAGSGTVVHQVWLHYVPSHEVLHGFCDNELKLT